MKINKDLDDDIGPERPPSKSGWDPIRTQGRRKRQLPRTGEKSDFWKDSLLYLPSCSLGPDSNVKQKSPQHVKSKETEI